MNNLLVCVYLHSGLGLPEVPGGVREEGGVGVVWGHGVRHSAQGGVGGHCAVLHPRPLRMRRGGAVRGVASGVRGAGEGGGRPQGVVVVHWGGHGVGLRVVSVLPKTFV